MLDQMSGMLHAFDAKTGKEEWAFVPPFVAPNLPNIMNVNLNQKWVGGSNAIYGVDGSIVAVHDMFFKSPFGYIKKMAYYIICSIWKRWSWI